MALSEVFRSPVRAECRERALVLLAVDIANEIEYDGEHYRLVVEPAQLESAQAHLRSYDLESRPAAPMPAPPPLYPQAWTGCAAYLAVLLGVGFAVSNGWWRLDAFEVGELDAGQVQGGQWWRAWTALTLHLDIGHLAANLGAGIWFGYLAGRQLGGGTAWFLIVGAAALANLFEGQFGPATHRAVGASTAVFAALGLLAAHSWRTRWHYPQRWALRWAPLIAGALLLGWLGSAGEGTDIVAHALGFVFGCLLGSWAALPSMERLLRRVPQWLTGAAAIASIGVAWACALLRG